MLRALFSQGSVAVGAAASSSRAASLHTSAVLNIESARKRQARLTRQKNLAKREELQKKAASSRPHVILGTVAGNETKWTSSDLARVLVRPEELAPDAPTDAVRIPKAASDIDVPQTLAFGLGEGEQRMLFGHLPLLSADVNTRRELTAMKGLQMEEAAAQNETDMAASVAQASQVAKLVDMRNANAQGIAFENRRRVIAEFSEPGKPNDTGRTEVQAALLTLQIRNVWHHLTQFKRDVGGRRNLRRLVHQRAKLLKYLKRSDRDRYERVLERLGLEPSAVEGELVV
ncbi:mitochondrial ribosomal protein S15 [Gloeopeniophorella convolvens]|nr:mitochondrial ribosomal protein S15 [Gloeopeniophorella convolvens]